MEPPAVIKMSSPQITLRSITGVDVELTIAGAGSRSFAFIIDWHIRLIFALAWFFGSAVAYGGGIALLRGEIPSSESVALVVYVPTLAIYFLYHPILEIAMRGRTPGKRMAGVRLVSRYGDIPSAGALLVRNVFRLLDSLPAFYVVGLFSAIFTKQHVRIGDLAAGTLLVVDHADEARSLAKLSPVGRLDPKTADLVHELLDRWESLADRNRYDLAHALLARIEPESIATLARGSSAELRERLRSIVQAEVS